MKAWLKKRINFFKGLWLLLRFRQFQLKDIHKSDIVFFFPYYHTGGAERVHLNIVQALSHKSCTVIFTHLSATTNFLEDFKKVAHVIELNSILNKRHSFLNNMLLKSIAKAIDTQSNIKKVFGSNTNYFYELLPFIKSNTIKVDLIHALADKDIRSSMLAKSAQYVNQRIVINKKTKEDLKVIYALYKTDSSYLNSIKMIPNGVAIPSKNKLALEHKFKWPIRVGFIGRWSAEKRPELFLEIAKEIGKDDADIEFVMAGTGMKSNSKKIENSGVLFLGELTTAEKLHNLYRSLHIIIICSEYEGFPMVLMESMPFGTVPICTDVGGISEHIIHNQNGKLIPKDTNELLAAFYEAIKSLLEDKKSLKRLSNNASNYACENFNILNFNTSYNNLLN